MYKLVCIYIGRGAENARPENDGQRKVGGLEMQNWKMRDHCLRRIYE